MININIKKLKVQLRLKKVIKKLKKKEKNVLVFFLFFIKTNN